MNEKEIIHILSAMILLAIVISLPAIIKADYLFAGIAILFSIIIIGTNVLGKKLAASALDASVEHRIWTWQRYGFRQDKHLKKEIPMGTILPIFLSIISLGVVKFMGILTYETSALKRRAAKRFGHYSYTEMTDLHISLIGAAGIITTLLLAFITYWIPPLEELSRMAAFYAFWNILPISKLDGTHIFFGSRTVWTILAAITVIFTAFAILLGVY